MTNIEQATKLVDAPVPPTADGAYELHVAFHRLWSTAPRDGSYAKREWMQLDERLYHNLTDRHGHGWAQRAMDARARAKGVDVNEVTHASDADAPLAADPVGAAAVDAATAERATQKLRAHGAALLHETYQAAPLLPPTQQQSFDISHTRLSILLDLLVDNIDPTLTRVREFIEKQLGGA